MEEDWRKRKKRKKKKGGVGEEEEEVRVKEEGGGKEKIKHNMIQLIILFKYIYCFINCTP